MTTATGTVQNDAKMVMNGKRRNTWVSGSSQDGKGGMMKDTRGDPTNRHASNLACSVGERDQHGDHDDCTWIDDGTSDGVKTHADIYMLPLE